MSGPFVLAVTGAVGHERWLLPLTDRFTGATRPLDETAAAAFAALTIVNELDIVRHGDLGPDATADITALVRALTPHAPDIARRALSELAPLSA